MFSKKCKNSLWSRSNYNYHYQAYNFNPCTIENNDQVQPHFAQLHVTQKFWSICNGFMHKTIFHMHAKVRQSAPRCAFGDFWTFTPWKFTYEANLATLVVCNIESIPQNRAKFQYLVCFNMSNATKELFWLNSEVAFLKSAQNEAEIGPFFNGCLLCNFCWSK